MSGAAGMAGPIVLAYGPTERTTIGERTVFIDRDGVINVNRLDHVKTWAEFQFLPGAIEGLSLLNASGYRVMVLTNQAAINRGLLTRTELHAIHDAMVQEIRARGGRVDGVLACPHRPEESCECRKPAPGLLVEARRRYGVHLQSAVLIGDHRDDLEAARRAGCRSLLVLSGRTSEADAIDLPASCLAALPDLLAAAQHVVALDGGTAPGENSPRPGG